MSRFRRARLALAAALALSLAGCLGGTTQQPTGERWVEGAGEATYAPDERRAAPAVTAETLDGSRLALADVDGPAVVNFWASWCGPCAREAAALRAVHGDYAERGVGFVGVNVTDDRTSARAFQRDHRLPFPSWHDEAGAVAADFGDVGPAALPSTLLLDGDHRVAARLFGAATEAQLAGHLDRLLAEQEPR